MKGKSKKIENHNRMKDVNYRKLCFCERNKMEKYKKNYSQRDDSSRGNFNIS